MVNKIVYLVYDEYVTRDLPSTNIDTVYRTVRLEKPKNISYIELELQKKFFNRKRLYFAHLFYSKDDGINIFNGMVLPIGLFITEEKANTALNKRKEQFLNEVDDSIFGVVGEVSIVQVFK